MDQLDASGIIAQTSKSMFYADDQKSSAIKLSPRLITAFGSISDKPEDVIPGSRIIIICSPSHVSLDILRQIKDYVDDNAFVGCIYGGGCFDLQAMSVLGS